jgi:hypothetical protein
MNARGKKKIHSHSSKGIEWMQGKTDNAFPFILSNLEMCCCSKRKTSYLHEIIHNTYMRHVVRRLPN